MITRVSTSTENYDPIRKGRRVVTIDKLHQELIGGTVVPAYNTRSDGSYNYTEIIGGEVVDDVVDAIRRFFCRVTGWCDSAARSVPQLPPAPRSRVVQMAPEDSGEAPGDTRAPEFDDMGEANESPTGLPASSAPEDYTASQSLGTVPPGATLSVPSADYTSSLLPPVPPPLPAAAVPAMQSVLSRVQAGDPSALKGLAALAQSAPFNPVSAQTLKNLATLAARPPVQLQTSKVSAAASGAFQDVNPITLAPAIPAKPVLTRRVIAGGSVGTVTHAVTSIFHLVLSPLAWTLDGTGRLTAVAGQKLEHLSRLL